MLRNLLKWLEGLFGVGVPTVLSLSSSLPGISGDDDETAAGIPTQEALARQLTKASIFLDLGKTYQARRALEQADQLSLQLTPHTTGHERLNNEKTYLWHRLKDR